MIMGPLTKLDKQEAIGMLKLAKGDKDVMLTGKKQLITVASMPKWIGTAFMIIGGLATITVLLAVVGIPMLIFGWWIRRRGVSSIEAVESAYAELAAGMAETSPVV
jgi:hypothetical protein